MLLTSNVIGDIMTSISCEWKLFLDLQSDVQLLQAELDFFFTQEILFVL